MIFFVKWLVMVLAILISGYFLPGVVIAGIWTAVWLSVFLAVINITIKPLFIVLTLPINILTLGLFTFVINALMIMLASSVIKGFEINGFWTAMLFSIVLSFTAYLLNVLLKLPD